jgi:hypothetical protein
MNDTLVSYLCIQVLFSILGLIVGLGKASDEVSSRQSLKVFTNAFIIFSFLYVVVPVILVVELIKFFVRVWRDE